MNEDTKYAIDQIKVAIKVKRLDPRALFLVDDGAYQWIGARRHLTVKTASQLSAITRVGARPDCADSEDYATADAGDYDDLCDCTPQIASSCGCGLVCMDDLPDSWQDGSALGPISPIY